MWLLVLMLLVDVPGIARVTVLKTFETLEGCQTERNRIGFDMAASYPYERTFNVDCLLSLDRRGKVKT